jgi:hypothetical protein
MKVVITIEVTEVIEEQGLLEHLEAILEDEYQGVQYTWEEVE